MGKLQALFAIVLLGVTPLAAKPLIIAHRGASGERPEHTLAAYQLAIEQGADFIEPDLVPTKDGHLVARHENEISGTTDVASRPEFAARKATKVIDGQAETGWFTEDFTLAELKSLRARERLPQLRSTAFDGQFQIPTFAEVLALAKARKVGVYPETKHPSYFTAIGLPLEARMLADLKAVGWTRRTDPVFIQSFEVGNLKRLRPLTKLRLVQLMGDGAPADSPEASYAAMKTFEGLMAIAAYADGIGPDKKLILPRDAAGKLQRPTALVYDAHRAGLTVHPWTLRAENYFLPVDFRKGDDPRGHGDLGAEACVLMIIGVDGMFSDFPGLAVKGRDDCPPPRTPPMP